MALPASRILMLAARRKVPFHVTLHTADVRGAIGPDPFSEIRPDLFREVGEAPLVESIPIINVTETVFFSVLMLH